MAYDDRSLDKYVDVAQRIADFRELYPDGSLQPVNPAEPYSIVQIPALLCRRCVGKREVKSNQTWRKCPQCDGTGLRREGEPTQDTFIVYICAAYRTPDDQRPGIGVAWEPYPGQTPYTAASELMNAETSAQGRAIVAALASDSKRGVSSREEVRNRRAEQEEHDPLGPPPGPRALADLPRNQNGSVSVSQCTEEELELHGFLTGEKRAEHNALRKGADGKLPKGEAARFRTCSPDRPCIEADCPQCTPGADLWTGEEEPPPALPLRKPKPAPSPAQQIVVYLERFGYTDKSVRLGITAQLAQTTRRLKSTNDLTASEGLKVLEVLRTCKDREALDEHLKRQEVMTDA